MIHGHIKAAARLGVEETIQTELFHETEACAMLCLMSFDPSSLNSAK
jgi:hypothetical protein